MSRWGFGEWHKGKWARRWNYGVPRALVAVGLVTMLVGIVVWLLGARV
jgi:hypothetical protein